MIRSRSAAIRLLVLAFALGGLVGGAARGSSAGDDRVRVRRTWTFSGSMSGW